MRLKSAALRGHRNRTDSCCSSGLCLTRIRSKQLFGGKVPESKRERDSRERLETAAGQGARTDILELSPVEKDKSCWKCTGWEGKDLLLVTDLPGKPGRSSARSEPLGKSGAAFGTA